MKKGIKYIFWFVILAFVAYNSVYFKKLSEVKVSAKTFNATAYAQDLLNNKLSALTAKAITIDELNELLKTKTGDAFTKYGHALAIGSTRFFLVKGSGTITAADDNDITLQTAANNKIDIATKFIYGNAIRDASGVVDLNSFTNTMDLSNISSAVNKIIRDKVIPPFTARAKKGTHIEFAGALELNQAHLNLNDLEIIPISIVP